MSLKDALTEHANVLRSKTGVSDTLSISDMTRLLVGLNAWIISRSDNGNNSPVKVKDERLYEGTEPGIWTPNPSDLTGGGRISYSASVMLPFYSNRLGVIA